MNTVSDEGGGVEMGGGGGWRVVLESIYCKTFICDQIQNLHNCLITPRQKSRRGGGPQTDKNSFRKFPFHVTFKTKRFCIVFYESYPSVVYDIIKSIAKMREPLPFYSICFFFAIHRSIWDRIEGGDPSSSNLGFCLTRWTDKKTARFKGCPILSQAAV